MDRAGKAEAIKTLDAEAKANRLSATLLGTGMVSFIVISGLIYFGFRQRMKKNQLEREQQETLLKTELAFLKHQINRFRRQGIHRLDTITRNNSVQRQLGRFRFCLGHH